MDTCLKSTKPFAFIKKGKDGRVERFGRKFHGRSRGNNLVTIMFNEAAVGSIL